MCLFLLILVIQPPGWTDWNLHIYFLVITADYTGNAEGLINLVYYQQMYSEKIKIEHCTDNICVSAGQSCFK
jgi:hypothetical protein